MIRTAQTSGKKLLRKKLAKLTFFSALNPIVVKTLHFRGGKNTTKITIISTLLLFLFSFSAYATQTETLFFNLSMGGFRIGSPTTGTLLNNAHPEYASKWEYSYNPNTLTLTDFEWVTSANIALLIVSDQNFNLNLVGTNTFESKFNSGSINDESAGIIISPTLSINGTGKLYAIGGNVTQAGASVNSIGIRSNNGIVIFGGTVTATGGTVTNATSLDYSVGISAARIDIMGGTVTATGGTATNGYSYGIRASANNVNSQFEGNCTVTATGNDGAFNFVNVNSPILSNYTLYKWTRSSDITGSQATSNYSPLAPYTYNSNDKYVKIEPAYTITYTAGSGMGSNKVDYTAAGDYIVEDNAGFSNFANMGFIFSGWLYNKTTYTAGATINNVKSNLTLTARWTALTAPSITSQNKTSVLVGNSKSFQVKARGIPAPTYGISGQPTGVSIDYVTGLITIANTVEDGEHIFTITATNSEGFDTQTFTLTVRERSVSLKGDIIINGGGTLIIGKP